MLPLEEVGRRTRPVNERMKSAALWAGAIAALILADHAHAQCLEWNHGFGVNDGVQGILRALTVFDDGHGPALYIGGNMLSAGDVQANSLVKWTSTGWSTVGGGVNGLGSATINAMVVFDDGTGPALYVAGTFTSAGSIDAMNVARWDGVNWTPLGAGFDNGVYSLCAFDDGTGPALYAGGYFTHSGTTDVPRIARWDGTSWLPLAPGAAGELNNAVASMAVFDDGSGPALFIGGTFTVAGGVGGNRLTRWDGSHFAPVGPALTNGVVGSSVNALLVFNDGTGPALFVAGQFSSAGGVAADRVAKWDGHAWSAVGSGLQGGLIGTVIGLTAFDDGSGNALYAGGNFTQAGSVPAANIAKWDGTNWSALGAGIGDYYAFTMAGFDDGTGPALYAAGSFTTAGGAPALRIARWKNSSWSPLPIASGTGGMDGPVYAFTSFDDGTGLALCAAGNFAQAGNASANRVARWKNGTWSALGSGLDAEVYALCVFNDGGGNALYAGGSFTSAGGNPLLHIAKWNGSSWIQVGSGVDDIVRAMTVYNDGSGSALYAGGDFLHAGSTPLLGLARWNGATWSDVGGGVTATTGNGSVRALSVFTIGGNTALYVGGSFSQAGGNSASNIARWLGTFWALGLPGSDGPISSFQVSQFGGGPALFTGGDFHVLGGQPVRGVAVWASGQWNPLAAGLDGNVMSLTLFDDGGGPAVIAGGTFVSDATHSQANHIARWDGFAWQPFGSGLDASVWALTTFQDPGSITGLYAGGLFHCAGELASTFIAEWRACSSGIDTFCGGDGSTMSCPCALDGLPGHGCQNSAFTGGAQLSTTGSAHPDTIVLHSSGELPHALSIFLQGDAVAMPQAFGDGWLCTTGLALPLFVKPASSGNATAPAAGDPSVTARSAALGDTIAPGTTRYYQTYYRDPKPTFCPAPVGGTWNVTNGVKITW
jgi:hypothetical protein